MSVRLLDHLDHGLRAAQDARAFVEGMEAADFLEDKRTQQAVVMSLIIIGEAAARIVEAEPEFAQAYPHIPWRSMRGMRNRIAHGYFDINLEVVSDTVQLALPGLIEQLPHARARAQQGTL